MPSSNALTPRASFVIRFWYEAGTTEPSLRVLAIDPHTGQQWGFADLEGLLDFLRRQMRQRQLPADHKGQDTNHSAADGDES